MKSDVPVSDDMISQITAQALLIAAKAYEATYMRTQSNPTPGQEANVMLAVKGALAMAQADLAKSVNV